MLLLTNERIRAPLSLAPARDVPFQPGELYVVKYMGQPVVVTVLARTATEVRVWFADLSTEEFNQRVLFQLGRRCRFLGMWLPWARCTPKRVIALGLDDSLGTDSQFWTRKQVPSAG
jgi:hypothetical protein